MYLPNVEILTFIINRVKEVKGKQPKRKQKKRIDWYKQFIAEQYMIKDVKLSLIINTF